MNNMVKSFLVLLKARSSLTEKVAKNKNKALKYTVYTLGVGTSFIGAFFTNRRSIVAYMRMLLTSKVGGGASVSWIPQFDVVLTTRCSLRCKYCCNLMQYYSHPYDVPMDVFKKSFDRLMSVVDYVDRICPIGGEPFVCRNLADALEFMMQYPQIREFCINTNGTVPIRDERLLKLLQDKRIFLNVSDYGHGDVDGFCSTLREHNISFVLNQSEKTWIDVGDVKRRNRTPVELRKQFHNCNLLCRCFLNGKLFYCPRAAHGADLGLIPLKKADYLDFLDDSHSVTRQELISFCYRGAPVEACNYCDVGTSAWGKVVPAGQDQLSEPISVEQ